MTSLQIKFLADVKRKINSYSLFEYDPSYRSKALYCDLRRVAIFPISANVTQLALATFCLASNHSKSCSPFDDYRCWWCGFENVEVDGCPICECKILPNAGEITWDTVNLTSKLVESVSNITRDIIVCLPALQESDRGGKHRLIRNCPDLL